MKLLFDVSGSANAAQDGWVKFRVYDRDLYNADRTRGDKLLVQKLASAHTTGPLIWDIEHWNPIKYEKQLIEIIDWVREVRPDLRTGFYGLLPERNYWGPVQHALGLMPNSYDSWVQHNARLSRGRADNGQFTDRGISDAVDFVCPSLYTFYSNSDSPAWKHEDLWHHYARVTIDEARKYQKPIYPFIWPHFHPSVHPKTEAMSEAAFIAQIETVLTFADGVCIWDDGAIKPRFNSEAIMRTTALKWLGA